MKVFKCQYCHNNYHGNYQQHFCSQQINTICNNNTNIDKNERKLVVLQPSLSVTQGSTRLSAGMVFPILSSKLISD